MRLVVSPGCGVVLDLDKVPSNPFKVCPISGYPLEAGAIEAKHHDDPAGAKQTYYDNIATMDLSWPTGPTKPPTGGK